MATARDVSRRSAFAPVNHTIHSRTATPGPFILASFLCTLQPATWVIPPYTLAATLDTGPLARSYGGGIYPPDFCPGCLVFGTKPLVFGTDGVLFAVA